MAYPVDRQPAIGIARMLHAITLECMARAAFPDMPEEARRQPVHDRYWFEIVPSFDETNVRIRRHILNLREWVCPSPSIAPDDWQSIFEPGVVHLIMAYSPETLTLYVFDPIPKLEVTRERS